MNAGSHGIWVQSCTAFLSTAITMIPAFSKFLKNAIIYNVNLVVLAKTAISPFFRNFCYSVQTWTCLKSMKNLYPPPPPHIKGGKMARFGSFGDGGMGVCCSISPPQQQASLSCFWEQVGEWDRERGMTSSFFSVVTGMDTPKSDCHLNSKYMHMIGDLHLKVVNERRQKTEENCR